jgi:hypothetical protein
MTRRYLKIRRRRPNRSDMNIKAARLAATGHVDHARAVIATTAPGIVVIEVNETTRGWRS